MISIFSCMIIMKVTNARSLFFLLHAALVSAAVKSGSYEQVVAILPACLAIQPQIYVRASGSQYKNDCRLPSLKLEAIAGSREAFMLTPSMECFGGRSAHIRPRFYKDLKAQSALTKYNQSFQSIICF